jgi:hypothetical protein
MAGQQGQDYIFCCAKADEPNRPWAFVNVTTSHQDRVFALCEEHGRPVTNLLPTVPSGLG